MALTYTTWADWVRAAGSETRLIQYAPNDTSVTHPLVEAAEVTAAGEMEIYVGKNFEIPLDDLPEPLKSHFLARGLHWLTDGADRRPETITKRAEAALAFYKDVAAGRAWLVDTDTGTPAGQPIETAASVYQYPSDADLAFNTSDLDSALMQRKPPL